MVVVVFSEKFQLTTALPCSFCRRWCYRGADEELEAEIARTAVAIDIASDEGQREHRYSGRNGISAPSRKFFFFGIDIT